MKGRCVFVCVCGGGGDGFVLYLDCGGVYTTANACQNSSNWTVQVGDFFL